MFFTVSPRPVDTGACVLLTLHPASALGADLSKENLLTWPAKDTLTIQESLACYQLNSSDSSRTDLAQRRLCWLPGVLVCLQSLEHFCLRLSRH